MAPSKMGRRNSRMARDSPSAMTPGGSSALYSASPPPSAEACALKPVEPTRRKPSSQ